MHTRERSRVQVPAMALILRCFLYTGCCLRWPAQSGASPVRLLDILPQNAVDRKSRLGAASAMVYAARISLRRQLQEQLCGPSPNPLDGPVVNWPGPFSGILYETSYMSLVAAKCRRFPQGRLTWAGPFATS